ncbi:chloride channel protein [Arachidicoccus sp.]|uniref:chloride channel protein n=1 Tax=Arachidicoccus sp. TaxID=1872624 RepID=UPI003D1ADCBC
MNRKVIKLTFFQIRSFFLFLKRRLTEGQFLLFCCLLVGALASIGSIILKLFVVKLEHFFFESSKFGDIVWYQALTPIVGIGLSSLLIERVYKKHFLKGNDKIVYAIAKDNSDLPFSQSYSHIVTAGLTVGLGGSCGLESPMVATGAAIGSNIGRATFLPYKEKTLLLACGIASGISSAFGAPIAGILFALEILLIDVSIASFIPLLMSSATGALLAKIILGDNVLLTFNNIQAFNSKNTFLYVGLGLLAGCLSLFYMRSFHYIDHKFSAFRSPVKRWLVGSLLLGVLIFLFPQIFGEGYIFVKTLAETGQVPQNSILIARTHNQWIIWLFILGTMIFKIFGTTFTLTGGGNGGSFAPSLVIGALLGYVVGRFFQLLGYADVPLVNMIVVGMAGMVSGLFFAPLTAIFLSAEVTNGYSLFIPLMIVAAISFFVVKSFEPLALEMKKLSQQSELDPTNKDKFLLSRLELRFLIRKDYPVFQLTSTMAEILASIRVSDKDVYAVTNEANVLMGVIYLNDMKTIILGPQTDTQNITAGDIMMKQVMLTIEDDMESAIRKYEKLNSAKNVLPIVDKEGKWLGFIAKASILDKYRAEIVKTS